MEVPVQTAFAIDYPGFVQDTEAALDTLGGIASVSKAHNGPGDVQVNCRPGDKLVHPIPAGKKLRNALLLSLSKPGSDDGQPARLHAEIVARVTCGYRFDGMADFQYIDESSSADPTSYPEVDGPFGKEREPLNIPPPLFSKQDTPQDYSFKTSPAPTARSAPPAPTAAVQPASGAQTVMQPAQAPRAVATTATILLPSNFDHPLLPSLAVHPMPTAAAAAGSGDEIPTVASGATHASAAGASFMPASAPANVTSAARPSSAQPAAALDGVANLSASESTALPSSGAPCATGGAPALDYMDTT